MVDELTDLGRGANINVKVTDVRRRGEKIMRIVNVYDQRDTQLGERQSQKVELQSVIWQGRTVLEGVTCEVGRW